MTERRRAPEFGSNSWLVDEMYRQYLENPQSVDESWREFFAEEDRATSRGPETSTAGTTTAPSTDEREPEIEIPESARPLRGGAAVIAENMQASVDVPTATSIRVVPAKLLEVNRRIVNNQLGRVRGGKVSFTHFLGWAMVKAMQAMPVMTTRYLKANGRGYALRPEHINLGLAIDVERPDGGRTLLVPNIKAADTLDFAGFVHAYEQVVRAVRSNKLNAELFADTTATLTNPGTVGTVGSVPRLMPGQSVIVGVGALDYPAEYAGADPRTLASIGVGKVMTLTSTYDHRVIQGAESGLFLQRIHELLLGEHGFYDDVFTALSIPYIPVAWHVDEQGANALAGQVPVEKQMAVGRLINAYRVRGHLIANLNPLSDGYAEIHPELDPVTYGLSIWDLEREFATGGLTGTESMRLGDILGVLRDAYCRTIGVEYMYISEPEQKAWIQSQVEGQRLRLDEEDQHHILAQLNAAEAFERFLHTKFIGQKRFSLEGAESAIPMLDALLDKAADGGLSDVVLGMAHRGRLNVLSNIIGKSYQQMFREFEGDIDPATVQGTGDVKYHLGSSGVHRSRQGNEIAVMLSSNPSHLEVVDGVVEGVARGKLERLGGDGADWPVLPVLLHGDAAFAGQGIVAETLELSQLPGYRTGGTIHLIINNQVGFTTSPEEGRSSRYATDVAKIVAAPVFHVNGDDPEACVRVMRLAFDFRQTFHKDVVVDLVCYRRWGHNEGDDPSYTQPLMYAAIEEHRSVRARYMEELVNRGDITEEEASSALEDFRNRLEQALKETRESAPPKLEAVPARHKIVGVLPQVETGVDRATLDRIVRAVTSGPEGFTIHPKLARQLERRRDQLARDEVDFAMGEALAFGSLVLEGSAVRLAGQDSQRGTFSQRHSVLVDYHTGEEYVPLQHLDADQAPFNPYDSPLSEFAALAFEYGYSVERTDSLVCWEAQFGDFVNGAQVVIDQFLVAAEEKWGQTSGLVLLLPHGYEGQGPEHSSARIERFLTLCAEDNIQVVQPTSAAQYFHVLRRQMHRDVRKPLVVFTPKGLLRAKAATSPGAAFTSGSFAEVLQEDKPQPAEEIQRVLLCSGRVAYDLMAARDEAEAAAAIVRVEQLYPFPVDEIREAIEHFPNAREVFWVQDEPENMGPWPFVDLRLHRLLRDRYRLSHVARTESASPAAGSHTIHEHEQADLQRRALADLAEDEEAAGEVRVPESTQAAG